jgi:deoxyribodipyrimidine photo-lyase
MLPKRSSLLTPELDLGPLTRLRRADLATRLADLFPDAVVPPAGAAAAADWPRGGREAATARLSTIDPVAYARSRNHVSGAVTMLSPWIRHGVLSLAEVRDAALARVARPEDAEKLVSELAWRDYWRQVHAALGDGIDHDIELPAAVPRRPPLDHLPEDVLAARTGMACIDAFVRRLHDTGWLHNHERMWLASWLVHVRGVHWRTGADWFLRHLLDGDPASNHLSWQWVAGTFAARPYLFNRENLETFTSGIHCRGCPVLGRCDVEGSYDDLAARLFHPASAATPRPPLRIRPAAPWLPVPDAGAAPPSRPLVWLTLDAASAASPAAVAFPESPRLFVVDPGWLTAERPALARLVFLLECLADVPGIEIRVGAAVDILPDRAAALGCDGIALADTPCPRVRRAAGMIAASTPVVVRDWPAFCDRSRANDLGRFSRYWQAVSRSALAPTPPAMA